MKLAIIGCGDRGSAYAAAAKSCGLTVSLCADVSERRARKLARIHNAAATIRCKMAIRSKNVDAAIVSTPTHTHAEYILSALRAGRPVLCESPFTRTLAQAKEIMQATHKSGAVCQIAASSTYQHEFAAIANQISAKKIGKTGFIRTFRSAPMPKGAANWYRDYAQSGGVTLDALAHEFNWISQEFGKVKKVFCQNSAHRGFDFSMVTLTLESGAIAQVIGSWALPENSTPTLKVEVCGTSGMIQFNSAEVPLRLLRHTGNLDLSPMSKSTEEIELQKFIEAIDENGESLNSTEIALQSMRVAEAALTSAKTGKAVKL